VNYENQFSDEDALPDDFDSPEQNMAAPRRHAVEQTDEEDDPMEHRLASMKNEMRIQMDEVKEEQYMLESERKYEDHQGYEDFKSPVSQNKPAKNQVQANLKNVKNSKLFQKFLQKEQQQLTGRVPDEKSVASSQQAKPEPKRQTWEKASAKKSKQPENLKNESPGSQLNMS